MRLCPQHVPVEMLCFSVSIRWRGHQLESTKITFIRNQTGSVKERQRTGKPLKTTSREDISLKRLARQQPFSTANTLRSRWVVRNAVFLGLHTLTRPSTGVDKNNFHPTSALSATTWYSIPYALIELFRTKSERTYPNVSILQELGTVLVQEWQQYPQHRLRCLIKGMRRRVQELYRIRGS
jgi:hypothetical protein